MPNSPLLWFGTAAKFLKSIVTIPGSTSGSISVSAGATPTTYSVTLPSAQATGALTNDGSGNLSWTPSSGGTADSSSVELYNLGLSASVASSLLTVALKQADGSTNPASGAGAVAISFRDSTLANGQYFQRTVTAALSVNTVATGATFGLVSAQNQYIWVYAIDNAGTVELALAGSRSFDEGTRFSTTAIGSGSTSAVTLYSTTARSNVAIRLIGRIKSSQTTSGTYASAPTEVSVMPLNVNQNPRSEIWLTGSTGYGSTGSTTIKWTTVQRNYGTGITYTSDAVNGDTFTINEDGIYYVGYSMDGLTAVFPGLSLNASGGTGTAIGSLSQANIIAYNRLVAANQPQAVSTTMHFTNGDVIRCQTDGGTMGTGQTAAYIFHMIKVSN